MIVSTENTVSTRDPFDPFEQETGFRYHYNSMLIRSTLRQFKWVGVPLERSFDGLHIEIF